MGEIIDQNPFVITVNKDHIFIRNKPNAIPDIIYITFMCILYTYHYYERRDSIWMRIMKLKDYCCPLSISRV